MRSRLSITLVMALLVVSCGSDETNESPMPPSPASATAELLPIIVAATPFADLLGDKISAHVHWLTKSVWIGNCNLCPASPLLDRFPEDSFAQFVDGLDVITKDGLEKLAIVGEDASGNVYLFGKASENFFVLWHDPDRFELIAGSLAEFIQWVIHECPSHLPGCPWQLYLSYDDGVLLSTDAVWHKKKVIPEDIYDMDKESLSWTHDFVSAEGFSLYNQELGFGLRFMSEYGGSPSHLRTDVDRRTSSRDELIKFWGWIHERGFEKVI